MKRYFSFLAIIIIPIGAICAAVMLHYETQYGIGVGGDGIAYFGTARNILAGNGFYYKQLPLTHFPPGYPALLALAGIGTDPLHGARYLHIILFALNTALVGGLIYKATDKSFTATLIAISFFLSVWSFQEIHVMAYSEAPFVTCMLIIIGLCAGYIRENNIWRIVLIGSIIGFAILLRYSGIVLIVPIAAVILFAQKQTTWLQRIGHVCVGVFVSIAPFALWLLRNKLTAASATNRSVAYHPVGWVKIKQLLNTLYDFWLPMNTATKTSFQLGIQIFQMGLLLTLILFILYKAVKHHLSSNSDMNPFSIAVLFFAGTFIIVYIPFLLTSITFYDAFTPLDRRILSLWHLMLLLTMIVACWQYAKQRQEKAIWFGFIVFVAIFLGFNIDRGSTFIIRRHLDGSGYTTYIWRLGLETIDAVVDSGFDVYTNAPQQVEVMHLHEVNNIPKLNHPNFETNLATINEQVESGNSVVVYFQWAANNQQPSEQMLDDFFDSPPLFRNAHYTVYGVKEIESMISQ